MARSRFAFAVLPLGFVVASACGSSSSDSDTSSDAGGSDGKNVPADAKPNDAALDVSTQDAADAANPLKDSSPDAQPSGECAGTTSYGACEQCCANKHVQGGAVYYIAYVDCYCKPTNCASPCSDSLCSSNIPAAPTVACKQCLKSKEASCASSIKTACEADANCYAFDSCIGYSGCFSKPE